MKAHLDSFGDLTIIGETDVERYALTQWWEGWQTGKKSGLGIQVTYAGNAGQFPMASFDIKQVMPWRFCDHCHKRLHAPDDEIIDTVHLTDGSVTLCRACYDAAGNAVRALMDKEENA